MRVRIIKAPPASYGIDGGALRIGRVYNLDASVASALMADHCAEVEGSGEARRESTLTPVRDDAADPKKRPVDK